MDDSPIRRAGAVRALGMAALLTLAGSAAAAPPPSPSRLIAHPDPAAVDLPARIAWAQSQARGVAEGGVWIGWAIDVFMPVNAVVAGNDRSSFGGRELGHAQPLDSLIAATAEAREAAGIRTRETPAGVERLKRVAVLLGHSRSGLDSVHLSELAFAPDLGGRPLLWLGTAPTAPSLASVIAAFEATASAELKGELVEVAGLHGGPEAVRFLAGVLGSAASPRVRAEAAEALGEIGGAEARAQLAKAARGDASLRVRSEAIEALADLGAPEAAAELIALAHASGPIELRTEAIEGLGQLAELAAARRALVDLLWSEAGQQPPELGPAAVEALASGAGTFRELRRAALELEVVYEEAAYTMGASRLQTFRWVLLPTLRGGLFTGSLLTFAHSLGEFGATVMVSGNLRLRTQTSPLYIFAQFEAGNLDAANAVAAVLALLSFVIFLVLTRLTGERRMRPER